MLNNKRLIKLNNVKTIPGNIAYWMSRDQRSDDNWALITAQSYAMEFSSQIFVVFALCDNFGYATDSHFKFMTDGLIELADNLKEKNLHFIVLQGKPEDTIPKFINDNDIKLLISDFDPLKIKRVWKTKILSNISIPFWEVDAHNIVPCRVVSDKQEFAAYTLRPKINRMLDDFLSEFPRTEYHLFNPQDDVKQNNYRSLQVLKSSRFKISQHISFKSGENEARNVLNDFIYKKLDDYANLRNDPTKDITSNLSPYLHFGQISSQRAAIEVLASAKDRETTKAFLEELIIRKELSDNFCFYNENYDSFDGFPEWAKTSLNRHRKDIRSFIYDINVLENADTHDDLWNTAQKEMLLSGKMNGYMRMYWAKKILEWSESPETALQQAIYLNDKYNLDGRDPNGYTGIAWSIGGVHDRAWNEIQIFGKIRFMSYNSQIKKINLHAYKAKVDRLSRI